MKMLKNLAILALCAALPAGAADFVSHADNKPQQLASGDKVQIVNLWATWCKPCRKEMPAMSKWYQQKGKKQGIELVGIAVDSPENVSKFLKATPVSYPIWRYTGANSRAMMRDLGNKVGGLPYTVVRLPKCGAEQTLLGEVDGAKLDSAVVAVKAKCGKK